MDGMRFACVPGCTDCCRVKGYVYLSEEDVRRAAAFLGMGPRAFEEKYVYRSKHLIRLRKPRRSQCPFLIPDGCGIHPAKPTQCRAFPFWPEMVGGGKGWREAEQSCRGIGRGPLVGIETAFRIAGEMREAYPGMYGRRK